MATSSSRRLRPSSAALTWAIVISLALAAALLLPFVPALAQDCVDWGETIQHGASGFIPKSSSITTLEAGIRSVLDGEALALGRVAVDDQDQLITHRAGSEERGVEVRRGRLDLMA